MGGAFADQLVSHTIDELIDQRLFVLLTSNEFPTWAPPKQNQWSLGPHTRRQAPFFIRAQRRDSYGSFGRNTNEIDLENLPERARPNGQSKLWYHATNWTAAESIFIYGANRGRGGTDFAKSGAYYLNTKLPRLLSVS